MRAPRLPRPSDRAGFTLVELLIALLISSLVLGTVFSLFSQYRRGLRRQQNLSEIQQNLRFGFAQLARDLAMAGYGMTGQGARYPLARWIPWVNNLTANPTIVSGGATGSDRITMVAAYDRLTRVYTPATAGSFAIVLPPGAGAAFDLSRRSVIYVGQSELLKITAIAGDTLTVSSSPTNTRALNWDHPAGEPVELVKAVTYSIAGTRGSATLPLHLKRTDYLISSPVWSQEAVTADVDWMKFARSNQSVQVILRGVARRPDRGAPNPGFTDGYRRLSMTNSVYLRNRP